MESGEDPANNVDAVINSLSSMNLSNSEKELVSILLKGPRKLSSARKAEQTQYVIKNTFICLGLPVPSDLANIKDLKELRAILAGGTKSSVENYNGDVNWLGSAVYRVYARAHLHNSGTMEQFKSSQEDLATQRQKNPYDPVIWYQLTAVYRELGFPELQASTAYKTKELIANGLSVQTGWTLGKQVFIAMARRLETNSAKEIRSQLKELLRKVMKLELYALAALECYKHGLRQVTECLEFFADDQEFGHMARAFEKLLIEANQDLASSMWEDSLVNPRYPKDGLKTISRASETGVIWKRKYPWMAKDLFTRSPDLVAQINIDLISVNCRVGACQMTNTRVSADNNEARCLGVFATRDIKEGDIVMIDSSNLNVTDSILSSSELCDNCLSTMAFTDKSKHVRPECCRQVVYCNSNCLEEAQATHHKILCGKDLGWLTKDVKNNNTQNIHWASFLLLRILAAILATPMSNDPSKNHPLQHPSLARLTAGYTNEPELKGTHTWNYDVDVIAQHRILRTLGIDPFKDERFSPEVMSTISWRIQNNACTITGYLKEQPNQAGQVRETGDMISLKQDFVFFNHSCDPNISWNSVLHEKGVVPEDYIKHVKQFLDPEYAVLCEEDLNPGGTLLVCAALKDIKEGEECRVSYLPLKGKALSERRRLLSMWFSENCDCERCRKEAESEVKNNEIDVQGSA